MSNSISNKHIILISFLQLVQMLLHRHTLRVIHSLHHTHPDVETHRPMEMEHGQMLLLLVPVGPLILGGIEIRLDHEIEFILIYTLIEIEVLRQFEIRIETEVEADQVVRQAEHELLLDLEELPDDENKNQAR